MVPLLMGRRLIIAREFGVESAFRPGHSGWKRVSLYLL